jgi:mevalonate kinase
MLTFYLFLSLLFIQEPDYQKKIVELNVTYQNCLDEGKAMVNCSRDFLSQMGELMDRILLDIQKNAPREQSDLILQNQSEWEVKIQEKFNLINQRLDSVSLSSGVVPQDDVMFANNDRARIFEDRIIELIDLLK